ncbi:P-loop NTPase fold protein [Burkholderia gladioli]|uniref:P-loop NTPase fold protein n=1 Tax=Burkholderia gladioli TaxID=28095 RepID=UPI0016420FDF|nr:P-loop NTPase fold protein [Burkholderia gladioli]
MSQKHVRDVITEFIDSEAPEVLAVCGGWGVGKTFAIKSIIAQYRGTKSLKKYAYVSVFGAPSLSSIKSTIVTTQRTLPLKTEQVDSKRDKIGSRFSAREWVNQFRDINTLGFKHIVVAAEMVLASMAQDMLIVIDDVERLSKAISMRDLMGLVSELKEQHRCKVILILNNEKLNNNREEFDEYREKVIDQNLNFTLAPSEAGELGLSNDTPLRHFTIDNIGKLEISNIRIIKKIERALKMLYPIVEKRSKLLQDQLAISICVFAAAIYERGRGFATPEEVLKYSRFARIGKIAAGTTQADSEPAWVGLLERVNFTGADDFDRGICIAMEHGYIPDSEIETAVANLDAAAHKQRLDEIFKAAWDLFHDRLDVSVNQLTNALMSAVKQSASVISTVNMNSTARLLRELGRNSEANGAIDEWITQNRATPSAFDLNHAQMFGEIDDPYLREKCTDEAKINRRLLPLQQAIDILVENERWDDAIPATLAAATRDELKTLIKNNQGNNLNLVVTAISEVRGGNEENAEIRQKLREALISIAEESLVNRLRVKRWGIDLDAVNAPTS